MKKIITQEIRKIKRYLPHSLKTRLYAVKMYRTCKDVGYVCRKYHISRTSLWRWNNRYDGTEESLKDKSHRPKGRHPKEHTEEEKRMITEYVKRNRRKTLNEIWYKLKRNKGYKRSITSLYRVIKKLGLKFDKGREEKVRMKKQHNKKYDTPKELGKEWQIDIKYVPRECAVTSIGNRKYYQYTCIEEADRERYLYWYEEITPMNVVDFVKRCIKYYKYKPEVIQTDNGTEFSYNRANIQIEHPMDVLLKSLGIKHYKIRPRTPQHNGKVERSHRNDNERFYSYLKFYNLEDLRKQGAAYLKRSNNIPMAVLEYLTPREKRRELELQRI